MRRVLVASKTCRSALPAEELQRRFAAAGLEADLAALDQRLEQLDRYEAIIIGTERVGAPELERAPRLKLVAKFGVGLDNIDQTAAAHRGVRVSNLPAVNSDAVAELAFGLMLSLARHVTRGDRCTRAGQWPRLIGTTLRGKTLGIVGTGAIGVSLARLSAGFGMRLLGADPVENQSFLAAGGEYLPLEQVLPQADFLSLHLPLCDKTRNLIGAAQLETMKSTAYLINTARGGIVDEAALFQALRAGVIAGAGLDVLMYEPPSESPLLQLEQVICTPHIAAYDDGTLLKMVDGCIQSVQAFFTETDAG